jgi:thiosulfate dehydrogenase [quinone] large subunit
MSDPASSSRSSATAVAALLLVQLVVGYEWLFSGLTKLHRGDFPDGLAAALDDAGKGAPGWYRDFLSGSVVPHAHAFGYAIEVAELLVGLVLVGGAFALLLGGDRISVRARGVLRLAAAGASAVALVLLVNFELASGGHFGLRLAADSFDEGVDLDTLMIGLQLALLVYGLSALRRPRGYAVAPVSAGT